MTLKEKIARLTEDRKKSVICKRARLNPNAIYNLLHRSHVPAADAALRLSRVLGVDLTWLLDDDQDWPPVRVEESETCHAA